MHSRNFKKSPQAVAHHLVMIKNLQRRETPSNNKVDSDRVKEGANKNQEDNTEKDQ